VVAVARTGVEFGIEHDWADRISRYEQTADVRVAEYAAHADDEVIG